MKNISECINWIDDNFLLAMILWCLVVAAGVGSVIYLVFRVLGAIG